MDESLARKAVRGPVVNAASTKRATIYRTFRYFFGTHLTQRAGRDIWKGSGTHGGA